MGEGTMRAKLDSVIENATFMLAVLVKLEREELFVGGNEEGEDYTECSRCHASEWGDCTDNGIKHLATCPYSVIERARG